MSTETTRVDSQPLRLARLLCDRVRGLLTPPVAEGAMEARQPRILLPLILLAIVTAILRFSSIDLTIAGLFYSPQTREWPYCDAPFWEFIDHYCLVPAYALGILGCVLAVVGSIRCDCREMKGPGLFLLMVLVIGPGLIVNLGFKRHWGRPRPREVTAFGGPREFAPVLTPGDSSYTNSSFPSGHAAVGFYLFVPAFLLLHRRRLARRLFWGGMAAGVVVGCSRIVQGGHFLSDVVWSAAAVYFTAAVLSRILLRCESVPQPAQAVGATPVAAGEAPRA